MTRLHWGIAPCKQPRPETSYYATALLRQHRDVEFAAEFGG